jgi:hypothetical protein
MGEELAHGPSPVNRLLMIAPTPVFADVVYLGLPNAYQGEI